MQEKAVRDVKKLYQSTGLKAKLNEDLSSGSQLLSNNLKKVYTISSVWVLTFPFISMNIFLISR